MKNSNENNRRIEPVRPVKKRMMRLDAIGIVLSVTFVLLISLVTVLICVLPDKKMSERENRVLEQKPSLSFSSITSGSFMKDFEAYLTDQFPFRDDIISLKTAFDRSVGKKEENGVYIGKKGFLFEKPSEVDGQAVKKLTDAVKSFQKANKGIKTAFILSPNSTDVLKDCLPTGLRLPDRNAALKSIGKNLSNAGISWIDCQNIFEKEKDKLGLFYRTDHHWTTDAAYLAFGSLAEKWKLDTKKAKFGLYSVSDTFMGTLASSSGVRNSSDEIKICVPKKSAGTYVVSYESSGRKTASLFEKDRLQKSNQYEVFLGGNYDKVIITTTTGGSKTLLVLKDSYANCMLPMLTPFFSRIVVIDPRYFNDNLSAIMKEYSFTHVLFVYNLNTFLKDNSLVGTLGS